MRVNILLLMKVWLMPSTKKTFLIEIYPLVSVSVIRQVKNITRS
jgi:hypothetical protein